MILVRRVGDDLWLGRADSGLRRSAVAPSRRLSLDRAMADRAESAAVRALGRTRAGCAVSRSHTGGVAAALAAPLPARVGVDVVGLGRISRRHLFAITGWDERQNLAGYGAMAGAVAWALKEAAAKATGDPVRWFPGGLRIVPVRAGLGVRWTGGPGRVFPAGWMRWGDLLCAWVWALEPGPGPAGEGPFDLGQQRVHGVADGPGHLVTDGPPPTGAAVPAPA